MNRIRTTVQLILAEPERHLWSRSYESDLTDVLGVQARVARAAAEAVQAVLTPGDMIRLSALREVNPRAHEAFLKARCLWGRWTQESVQLCLRYVKEALEADPTFAPAHSLLADALVTLGYWGFVPAQTAFPQAKEAAQRAIALDDLLSEAHVALAWTHWLLDWDLAACGREIQRALELNPSGEMNHLVCGLYQATIVRDRRRAEEAAWLALDIDPLSVNTNFGVAWILLFAGAYTEAVAQATRAIELYPESPLAHQALGWACAGQGRYAEAASAFGRAAALSNDAHSIAGLGYSSARAGQVAVARRVLEELTERSGRELVPDVIFAVLYAGLDDPNRAFESLERCYQQRDPHLFWLPVMPAFLSLQKDGRYHDLLRRIGITP